jgi:hypothetical protein
MSAPGGGGHVAGRSGHSLVMHASHPLVVITSRWNESVRDGESSSKCLQYSSTQLIVLVAHVLTEFFSFCETTSAQRWCLPEDNELCIHRRKGTATRHRYF